MIKSMDSRPLTNFKEFPCVEDINLYLKFKTKARSGTNLSIPQTLKLV